MSALLNVGSRAANAAVKNCMGSAAVRRGASIAPDYPYWMAGIKRSEHYRALASEGMQNVTEFPEFMSAYFKVAAVMKSKGLVPYAHAQPSAYRVPRLFAETLSKKAPDTFFRYLREPSAKFRIDRETIMKRIEEYVKTHGDCGWTPGEWNFSVSRLDTDPEFRPYLVSVSYSMMDFTRGESAVDFLFRNSAVRTETIQKIAEEFILSCLRKRGLRDKAADVLARLSPLYAKYSGLDMNSLFVIGVPEDKVSRYMYDSKSFGIPTYEDVEAVSKAPWSSSRAFTTEEGGLQARLLMYKETMDPTSGLEVVDVNDDEEVKRYCSDATVADISDMPEIASLFPLSRTKREEAHKRSLRELDQYVRSAALSV